MGLVGVIISSSAGCLGVALSLFAIRRNVRRRKCHQRKRMTDLRLMPATDTTSNNGTGARNTAFIKTSSSELMRKRRATVVQTHSGNPTVGTGSYDYAVSKLYGIHKNPGRRYPTDVYKATIANNVAHQQAENTTTFHQGTQTASSPLKEFTVAGSSGTAEHDHSTHDSEKDSFFTSNLAHYWSTSSESCSETESCSFAGDEFLSEEDVVGTTEDEGSAETVDKSWEFSQSYPKRVKRVSFQFANGVGQQRELSNSRADHENPVAENVLAIENLLQTEDVEIIPGNDEVHNETSETQSGALGRFLEVVDRRILTGGSGALAMTQEYSEGNDREQDIVFQLGKHDKTAAKGRKPLFVSAEPLAQMPALDDAFNLSPTTSSTEAKGPPISWAVDTTASEPNHNPKDYDRRDFTSAAELQKDFSRGSYRSSGDEKENISGSPASSPERLSRKPRAEVERPGMFRRSSFPSLRRFRFSDRIKVRPLRSSARNSK